MSMEYYDEEPYDPNYQEDEDITERDCAIRRAFFGLGCAAFISAFEESKINNDPSWV